MMNMDSTFRIKEARGLSSHPAGATGRVQAIETDNDADRERLEVMGLCAGRTIEVVQTGDPMIVRVLGTRIGLAARLANSVLVELYSHP